MKNILTACLIFLTFIDTAKCEEVSIVVNGCKLEGTVIPIRIYLYHQRFVKQ